MNVFEVSISTYKDREMTTQHQIESLYNKNSQKPSKTYFSTCLIRLPLDHVRMSSVRNTRTDLYNIHVACF